MIPIKFELKEVVHSGPNVTLNLAFDWVPESQFWHDAALRMLTAAKHSGLDAAKVAGYGIRIWNTSVPDWHKAKRARITISDEEAGEISEFLVMAGRLLARIDVFDAVGSECGIDEGFDFRRARTDLCARSGQMIDSLAGALGAYVDPAITSAASSSDGGAI